MKKTAIFVFTFLLSLSAFACPGVEEIQLNDRYVLTAFSVREIETYKDYMFVEDLERSQSPLGVSYTISDKSKVVTHKISLAHMQNDTDGQRILVMINNLLDGSISFYKGQYGRMRSIGACNEIVPFYPPTVSM